MFSLLKNNSLLLGLLMVFFLIGVTKAQTKKIQWLNSIEEYYKIDSAIRKQKPIYIDLYTDWCGYCKIMDKNTFTNDSVVAFLNEHFIPIKLNAETKEKIVWRGINFEFDSRYNINTFALYLTGGSPGFPTSVIIQPNLTFEAIPGYLQVPEMERILKFYTTHSHNTDFAAFSKNFTNKW